METEVSEGQWSFTPASLRYDSGEPPAQDSHQTCQACFMHRPKPHQTKSSRRQSAGSRHFPGPNRSRMARQVQPYSSITVPCSESASPALPSSDRGIIPQNFRR